MPKISAPTVAEHRSAQHAAMIGSAEAILLSEGVDAVTPAAVTSRAGLARSTFYEYFPSKDDLLVALAHTAFERWGADMSRAVQAAAPGADQLRAYVTATLRFTCDGRHALATALRGVPLSPKGRNDVVALHAALDDPLLGILQAFHPSDPKLTASLVRGLLGSAMALVTGGRDVETVIDGTLALLTHGVGSEVPDTMS